MVLPPVVTVDDASKAAAQMYGWQAEAVALTGERDKNYLLRTAEAGDVVLKFINPAEEAAETDLQIQVLLWLEQHNCAVMVPKTLRTAAGELVGDYAVGDQVYKVRAYTYLNGVSVAQAQMSDAMQQSFGEHAAQLVLALEGFDQPALSRVLLWDVMHLNQLRAWAEEVLSQDELGQCVFAYLDRFEQTILPALQALPQQVIHGDISKSNTVASSADAASIHGVLDFGDLCKAPRVVELAVAASYALDAETGDLQAALARVVDGYAAVLPLSSEESTLVFDLIIARLVQRIVISEWRASHFPNNRDYILRSTAQARQLLGRLMHISEAQKQSGKGQGNA